jgi:hypothetical protein
MTLQETILWKDDVGYTLCLILYLLIMGFATWASVVGG